MCTPEEPSRSWLKRQGSSWNQHKIKAELSGDAGVQEKKGCKGEEIRSSFVLRRVNVILIIIQDQGWFGRGAGGGNRGPEEGMSLIIGKANVETGLMGEGRVDQGYLGSRTGMTQSHTWTCRVDWSKEPSWDLRHDCALGKCLVQGRHS